MHRCYKGAPVTQLLSYSLSQCLLCVVCPFIFLSKAHHAPQTALFEDGQASLSPSSLTQEQDNSTHSDSSANDNDFVDTQSDSSDDDLEVVLGKALRSSPIR